MKNLCDICLSVCDIAKATGSYIKGEQSQLKAVDIDEKMLNNLVSYVDKTAEEKIVSALQKLTPEAGFLAEEATVTNDSKEYTWVIDPLDGTTNFIHQIPAYSVSIALLHQNQLILGVVYEINQDECFYSWGAGAFLNGQKIHVATNTELKNTLLATGFPYYDFHKTDQYLQLLKHFILNTRGIRRLGSAAVDLCYVACGRFDAFFEYSLSPWDVAAGAFIVQQAGGTVTDFSSGDNYLFGKEIVAGSTSIWSQFYPQVQKHLA